MHTVEMIVSASRRTDIPAFYTDWFFRRLEEGRVLVRNPMNPRMISSVSLLPEKVECLAFWTKNPSPIVGDLGRLSRYGYFFHFTLNSYGEDLEPGLPSVNERLETFRRLSAAVGRERVLWRYDPIVLSETYPFARHVDAFRSLARELKGATDSCTVSFVTPYRKIGKTLRSIGAVRPEERVGDELLRELSLIASGSGMSLRVCSDGKAYDDVPNCGRGRCVDPDLVESILGSEVVRTRDPGQRKNCGCLPSVDIGAYATCMHGCSYCYAAGTPAELAKNRGAYDPDSPLLCGTLGTDDTVYEREMKSCLKVPERRYEPE